MTNKAALTIPYRCSAKLPAAMPDRGKHTRGESHCSNKELDCVLKLGHNYIGEIACNETSLQQTQVLN
jgi:hypothetical protein